MFYPPVTCRSGPLKRVTRQIFLMKHISHWYLNANARQSLDESPGFLPSYCSSSGSSDVWEHQPACGSTLSKIKWETQLTVLSPEIKKSVLHVIAPTHRRSVLELYIVLLLWRILEWFIYRIGRVYTKGLPVWGILHLGLWSSSVNFNSPGLMSKPEEYCSGMQLCSRLCHTWPYGSYG